MKSNAEKIVLNVTLRTVDAPVVRLDFGTKLAIDLVEKSALNVTSTPVDV